MGGMGDDIIGSPGSFSSMNEWDKMMFVAELDQTARERRDRELAEKALTAANNDTPEEDSKGEE